MVGGRTGIRKRGRVGNRSQAKRQMGGHQQPCTRSKTGPSCPPAPVTVPCPSLSPTRSCSPASSVHSYTPPLHTSRVPSTSRDPPANFPPQPQYQDHPHPSQPQSHLHGLANLSSNPELPGKPWGVDPTDGRMWIYPDGDTFYPVVDTVRDITRIIQLNFDRPCYTWSEADNEIKELWFKKWMERYKWLPQHDLQIRKHWKFKAGQLLRSMMHNVRNNLEDRPIWIPEDVLNTMKTKWSSEDYRKKQEQAKKNRASNKGGSIHTGGSIPLSEHKRRMKKEIGRQPSIAELFVRTHKKRGTDEFIDKRSADVYAEFNRLKTARSSKPSVAGTSGNIDEGSKDTAIWLEAVGGRDKKGRIFGAGSERGVLGSSAGKTSSTAYESYLPSSGKSAYEPWLQKFKKELEIKDQALERQREQIAEQQELLKTYERALGLHDRMSKELLTKLKVPPIDDDNEKGENEEVETGDDAASQM